MDIEVGHLISHFACEVGPCGGPVNPIHSGPPDLVRFMTSQWSVRFVRETGRRGGVGAEELGWAPKQTGNWSHDEVMVYLHVLIYVGSIPLQWMMMVQLQAFFKNDENCLLTALQDIGQTLDLYLMIYMIFQTLWKMPLWRRMATGFRPSSIRLCSRCRFLGT